VRTESGATLWWPYGEVRQTQGSYAGEQVRLERGGDLPEALLVADADFLASLHGISPEVAVPLRKMYCRVKYCSPSCPPGMRWARVSEASRRISGMSARKKISRPPVLYCS